MTSDEGDVRVGLGIGQQCRPTANAGLEHSRGHSDGERDPVADEVRERALLTCDVSPRSVDETDLDGVGATSVALIDRGGKRGQGACPAMCGNVDNGGADCLGCQHGSVEYEMRVARDELGVLARRGFALHGVDNHDRVFA